jgi:hypothetical protein
LMPESARTMSNDFAGPIRYEEPGSSGPIAEVSQESAGLLGRPWSVRIRGGAEDVDVAAADLEHEEHLDPAECDRAVDVEEVACQHRGRLAA